jgi:hypothetical protein
MIISSSDKKRYLHETSVEERLAIPRVAILLG